MFPARCCFMRFSGVKESLVCALLFSNNSFAGPARSKHSSSASCLPNCCKIPCLRILPEAKQRLKAMAANLLQK